MKKLLLLLTICTTAMARPADAPVQHTRIAEDDATITIQIDRENSRQPAHYQHSFNVAGMNWVEKDLLKIRVFADQGVVMPFHEIADLVVLIVGILALAGTLLVVNYQASKRPALSPSAAPGPSL